ncbi:autoinducer binding domain-containing protein [Methylibium sp.]|uniref:autoinducer binding domain-containing protein n=1 Tax=Methylibium sp. TaxID=2067992 RepID=UPI003D13E1D1
MRSCAPNGEPLSLLERTRSVDCTAQVCETVARIGVAADEAEAIGLLRLTIERLGADEATFTSFIRDDATLSSYRCLLACNPLWGAAYARHGWCADDPWLHHAMQSSDPIRTSDMAPDESRQRIVVEAAAEYGFRSAVIVPAPSSAGQSRVGVLCIGSATAGYFDDDGFAYVKPLLRGLAMELHDWWHQRLKRALIARAHITDGDLALLRYEAHGHSSKVIAVALHTEAKTIDCRFQRLNGKLGVANRRDAVRLGKLYGLI